MKMKAMVVMKIKDVVKRVVMMVMVALMMLMVNHCFREFTNDDSNSGHRALK